MTPLQHCDAIEAILTELGLPAPYIGERPETAYAKIHEAIAAMAPYYNPTDLSRRYWERT